MTLFTFVVEMIYFVVMFQVIEVFKRHYESPFDIDVIFSLFEKDQEDQTILLPQTVATVTCLQYKRLKCSDRFFYSWNKFYSPGMATFF